MDDPDQTTGDDSTDRWLTEPTLTADLPRDVRTGLGAPVGDEEVSTLRAWVSELRRLSGGGGVEVDDLCHADAETPHWGELAGERHYFLCFYDAVLLSGLADEPVNIRTESPDGTVIRARAIGTDDLTVTPADAVVSFGVAAETDAPSDGAVSMETLYSAICPYVRAFPDRDAYREWRGTVPAATVAMPLAGATDLAAAMIG